MTAFKRNLLVFVFLTTILNKVGAQKIPMTIYNMKEPPKREVRAVWLTTLFNLDWPKTKATSSSSIRKQKQELISILDRLHKDKINTVLLQTRVRATTIYPSAIEPWDGCMSGTPGTSPGYDPLQFAIDECHKRGMELHAWVVTIPVGKWDRLGCSKLREKFGDMIVKIDDEGYMNPEDSRTGDYIASVCKEITDKYDIDGIHLDYIRYPETWKMKVSKDEGRNNITSIVRKINAAVKNDKPWVKLSCSPIGKYSDLPRKKSHGWNAYERVCQDAQAWLRDDLMDQLYPMMYFRDDNFYPFANDWRESDYGKMVVPGLGIYFLDSEQGNWKIDDITREMYHNRNLGMGYAFFRNKFYMENHQGIKDFTGKDFNTYPALVPADTWSKRVKTDSTYNIYASTIEPVDLNDPRNLVATRLPKSEVERTISYIRSKHYVVTSMDRYGVETLPKPKVEKVDTILTITERPLDLTGLPPFLECDGRNLTLPKKPSEMDAEYIQIDTYMGQRVALKYYKGNNTYVGNLKEGIYVLKAVNKQHVAHRLGIFEIKR